MKEQLTFKEFITEELSIMSLDKAIVLITKYLKRKTGIEFFRYPGIEKYKNNSGVGFGIRFYSAKKSLSVRFNWDTPKPQIMGLGSVDIFLGNTTPAKPYNISFDNRVSLVKTLPIIANILTNKKIPTSPIYTLPDGVLLNEGFAGQVNGLLLEATADPFDLETMYDDILDMVTLDNFSKGKIYSKYKGTGFRIFDALETAYPNFIQKTGTKYSWVGKPRDLQALKKEKEKILRAIGAEKASVSVGSAKETYEPTGNIAQLEDDRERLTFEKQLEDMENLLKLTIKGSANAMFVAGRGGVGKTHTTEKVLNDLGLRDGTGYFKNTGSISAAGMYNLLFKYKNDTILFDDSDDALADQSSRNLLKAATDTKKIRKLVWNKMGSNVIDPDTTDLTDEEIIDQGLIPRYFNFTGKIIFISNLPMNKLDPDGALRTRAFLVDINPTESEVYDFMEKIVGDIKLEDGLTLDMKGRRHVVDLLRKGKSKQSPNLRKLSRGLNMAAGAIAAGVNVSDAELQRIIEMYA